jgi:hypothetical protein
MIEENIKGNISELIKTKKGKQHIFNTIENLKKRDGKPITKLTIKKKHIHVKTYLIKNNLEDYMYPFDENPEKVYKEFPPRKELVDLVELIDEKRIEDIQDKLILRLLTNYPVVLRTDLKSVKINDIVETEPHFKKDRIIFPTIVKTNHKNIIMELLPQDIQAIEKLIQNGQDYLIKELGTKNKDKSALYSKYIERITKQHLQQKLIQTDFRKICERDCAENIGVDKEFIKKYLLWKSKVELRGHSVDTTIAHYL